jgi:phenylacetate-coenzyme A ligase PaaK-like adenylate-forming protein
MTTDAHWDPAQDTRDWASRCEEHLARVPDLVQRLVAVSPFYRSRLTGFETARTADRGWLADLPFTTKDDLHAAQEAISDEHPLGALQCAPTSDLVQVIASSGTTGLPVFFGLTAADWRSWRHGIANLFFTAGVRRGSVVALTTGMPMVAGGLPFADGIREAGATLAWVGGQTTARMASIVERLKVGVLVGTASFAQFFADACGQALGRPARELSVTTLIGGGEPGLGEPEIRQRVAEGWGATRVSEIMGLGDVMSGLWAECDQAGGMHFTAGRDVLVELIDPDGGAHVAWDAGAEGEAVYTTLTREATPVLRYRSRDHLRVMATSCACGRAAPRVRCVGRTDDMLIYKAMNVFPSAIRDVVLREFGRSLTGAMRIRKSHPGQVRFDEAIPLEVEVGDGLEPAVVTDLRTGIAEAVRRQLRVRVDVEPVATGTIPVGAYKNPLTYVREDGASA